MRSSNRLFVQQTKDFLFYGTHSAFGTWCSRRYREWLIQGLSLGEKKFPIVNADGLITPSPRSEPIQLHGFAGSEIGSTVCFKVHDGYFYAVTNCDAFDVIEVDFTSFYHCVRFPLDDAQKATCQAARRIYRRQHMEGPVNDGWNSLALQVDERTNELLIVEGRAEWPFGGGTLSRGYYAQKIDFDNQELELVQERQMQVGPADNPLSKIPDDETKYCPTPELPSWHCHLEAANESRNDSTDLKTLRTRLSRSKYRTYNFTCMAALELVEQPCSCRGIDAHCLQLRSASRKPRPFIALPHNNEGDRKGKKKANERQVLFAEARTVTDNYRYTPISLWPKFNKSNHDAMNLPAQLQGREGVEIKAWADERCIVYLVHSGGIGKVVCLNFDGDAPVARFNDVVAYTPSQARGRRCGRGRSPHQQPDPEILRRLSPPRQSYDHPVFDPGDAEEEWFESTWDLDGIPDAEQLGMLELEEWFDLLSGKSATAPSCP
jgi:hypothetical protein